MRMNLPKSLTRRSLWRRKLAPYLPLGRWMAIVVLAAIAVGTVVVFGRPVVNKIRTWLGKPLTTLTILYDPLQVLKETGGRTNILLLGRGGSAHEAADLTDTILLISIRHRDRRVSLISIPRDIWIDSMKAKINSAYYFGEQKAPGGGLVLARDGVFQVTDMPIHYTILVDFIGFMQAIDLVGGVEVEVGRAFIDEKYPLELADGSKPAAGQPIYETVRFEAGKQLLDGTTALKYVRSRYSSDPEEGTDFARSRRQQQVFLALAKKLKERETVLSLQRIRQLKGIFSEYTKTDIADDEAMALGRLGMGIDAGAIENISLDSASGDVTGLLVNPPVAQYGQWVLVPRSGNWQEVHQYLVDKLAAHE